MDAGSHVMAPCVQVNNDEVGLALRAQIRFGQLAIALCAKLSARLLAPGHQHTQNRVLCACTASAALPGPLTVCLVCSNSTEAKMHPEVLYSHKQVVAATHRVTGPDGDVFYRIAGTTGWLFQTRVRYPASASGCPAVAFTPPPFAGWQRDPAAHKGGAFSAPRHPHR